MVACLVGRSVGRSVGWLVCWVFGWLVGWFVGWVGSLPLLISRLFVDNSFIFSYVICLWEFVSTTYYEPPVVGNSGPTLIYIYI